MAGLTKALIQEREIHTSGGTFTVGGLDSEAIFGLFQRRRDEIGAFYARIIGAAQGGVAITLDQANSLASGLIADAPEIAAEIIAMASGEPDDEYVAIARALPFPTQIAALEAIADLTFTSEMPPKKVLETVVKMLNGMTGALADLSASKGSSGVSVKGSASAGPTAIPTPVSTRSGASRTKRKS